MAFHFSLRERLDRGDELHAGVVDEDVDGAELDGHVGDKPGDLFRIEEICREVARADVVLRLEARAEGFDFRGVAEAVERNVAARGGKALRDLAAEAAG